MPGSGDVVIGGVVTVGVVTVGVVTVGVVTGGVTGVGGTVTVGTVTGGTVTDGTVVVPESGGCCALAGSAYAKVDAAATPSHLRRDMWSPFPQRRRFPAGGRVNGRLRTGRSGAPSPRSLVR